MKERNTHPIAPVLAEADNLAAIATRLLEAADELEKAQLAADKDSSTTNMDMLEHAKALQRDRAADMRFNIDEYSKRIERHRDADGRDTRLIAAANAALHYIAAIHGAEVPMAPFDADLTASALAGALNPYKTPHGRKVDCKMVTAISTAQPQDEPVARDVLMALAKSVESELITGGYVALTESQLSTIVDRYAAQPPAVAVPDDWRDAAHAAVIGLGAVRTSIERGDTDKALSRVNEIRAMLAAAPQGAGTTPSNWWVECPNCGVCTDGISTAAPQATAEDSSVVQADAPAPATEYSWSNNGEEYHGRFSSVAEAVCDYLDSEGDGAGEVVHVGEVKPHEPGKPIWLADNVLEMLTEQAYDEAGECAEDWPELPPEKREQLGKMIQDFVWTNDAPRFFGIGKSELVEVAAYRDATAAQKGGEA